MSGGDLVVRKLFLVQADMKVTFYMRADPPPRSVIRLVWASSEEEAEKIFRAHCEVNDPYGDSTDVFNVVAEEALE